MGIILFFFKRRFVQPPEEMLLPQADSSQHAALYLKAADTEQVLSLSAGKVLDLDSSPASH